MSRTRGLDVDDLSHVLNYTLPDDLRCTFTVVVVQVEAEEGVSVTLVTPKEDVYDN